jgi:hypothetical protein
VAFCIQGKILNEQVDPIYTDFPTVEDGVRGMKFLEAVVRSGSQDEIKWISM